MKVFKIVVRNEISCSVVVVVTHCLLWSIDCSCFCLLKGVAKRRGLRRTDQWSYGTTQGRKMSTHPLDHPPTQLLSTTHSIPTHPITVYPSISSVSLFLIYSNDFYSAALFRISKTVASSELVIKDGRPSIWEESRLNSNGWSKQMEFGMDSMFKGQPV